MPIAWASPLSAYRVGRAIQTGRSAWLPSAAIQKLDESAGDRMAEPEPRLALLEGKGLRRNIERTHERLVRLAPENGSDREVLDPLDENASPQEFNVHARDRFTDCEGRPGTHSQGEYAIEIECPRGCGRTLDDS